MNPRDIDTMIDKHKLLMHELLTGMMFSTDIAVALEEQNEGEQTAELEKTMKEYVAMEDSVKRHITALTDLKRQIQGNSSRGELAEVFEARLQNLASNADKAAYKNHPKYKEFQQKTWAVHHPDEAPPGEDQDIVLMPQGGDSELICPLTRKELENPLRNQLCGHCYSQVAIMHYISNNTSRRGISCPVAGCNATISKQSLEKDVEKERQLRKKQSKRKRQTDDEEKEDVLEV